MRDRFWLPLEILAYQSCNGVSITKYIRNMEANLLSLKIQLSMRPD